MVPNDYIGKAIEVIVFMLDKNTSQIQHNKPTFNALRIDTLNFRFNGEEANER